MSLLDTRPRQDDLSETEALVPTVTQLYAEANAAQARGDIPRTRECLNAALEISPGNGEVALALGHVELSAGNLEAALAAYWTATLLLPERALAHSSRALALRLLGRTEEASRDAMRALSLDPTDALGLKVLARIHLDSKQPEAAQKSCRLILALHEEDPDAREMLEEAIIQEAKLAENLMDNAFIRKASPPRRQKPA